VPILFAPLLGFLLGVILAWIAREELTRDASPARGPWSLVVPRPIVVSAALACFVYAPVVGYFVAFHGDWSYLYLYPHSRIPSAVDLALVLVAGAAVPLGTRAAEPAARAKKLGVIMWLGAVPGAIAAGVFAWGSRRLSVSATYAGFHGGFGATPISASALGRGVLFMLIVGALGVAWTVRSLARTSRPERPRRGGRAAG
jgi:hypothetical protein